MRTGAALPKGQELQSQRGGSVTCHRGLLEYVIRRITKFKMHFRESDIPRNDRQEIIKVVCDSASRRPADSNYDRGTAPLQPAFAP